MKNLKKIISLTILNLLFVTVMVFVLDNVSHGVKTASLSASPTQESNAASNTQNLNNGNIGSSQESTLTPTLAAPTVAQKPNNSVCIITIDSQKYDVMQFQNIHSAGNVFNCGTDMTADFYSKHDKSYLVKMEKYKIP